jgi:hypothetical protein
VCTVGFIYYSFLSKEHTLQDVGVMCALLVLYTIVFAEKNIFCWMLGLCVHC